MTLEATKCYRFLFSLSNKDKVLRRIEIEGKLLPIGSKEGQTWLRILGVYVDQHLTMYHHLHHVQQWGTWRLSQFARIANSIYGIGQVELRSMYVAYVQSIITYAAPAWYPCLCKTNLGILQSLRKA